MEASGVDYAESLQFVLMEKNHQAPLSDFIYSSVEHMLIHSRLVWINAYSMTDAALENVCIFAKTNVTANPLPLNC